ncbi:MAG: hypothetical protein V9H25_10630 [Candidatus Competibacter sp.]
MKAEITVSKKASSDWRLKKKPWLAKLPAMKMGHLSTPKRAPQLTKN